MSKEDGQPLSVSDTTPLRLRQELDAANHQSDPERLQRERDADGYLRNLSERSTAAANKEEDERTEILKEILVVLEDVGEDVKLSADSNVTTRNTAITIMVTALVVGLVCLFVIVWFFFIAPGRGF